MIKCSYDKKKNNNCWRFAWNESRVREELLDECQFIKGEDRLILAGDVCDRGPDTAGVIRRAIDINAEFVIGNHDDKYIRYRRHEQKKTHTGRKNYKNPIKLDENKQKVWDSLDDELLDYMEAGKYCVPVWEYNAIVLHAGVVPGSFPDKREREEYIFTRYIHETTYKLMTLGPEFKQPENSVHWSEVYDGTVDIIYGHFVQSFTEPVVRTNAKGARTIGIDNGACFGGVLTAMIFETDGTERFVHIKPNKIWRHLGIGK